MLSVATSRCYSQPPGSCLDAVLYFECASVIRESSGSCFSTSAACCSPAAPRAYAVRTTPCAVLQRFRVLSCERVQAVSGRFTRLRRSGALVTILKEYEIQTVQTAPQIWTGKGWGAALSLIVLPRMSLAIAPLTNVMSTSLSFSHEAEEQTAPSAQAQVVLERIVGTETTDTLSW